MKAYIVEREAVRSNIRVVQKKAAKTPVWAVLKGNGYGLGLLEMAALCREEGIDRFAITEPADARLLRENGYETAKILMLRATAERAELEELLDLQVICTIGSYEDAVALNGIADGRGEVAAVHLKIDTGMGRYGFLPTEVDKVLSVYQYMNSLAIEGIYTHFHSAFCNEKQTYAQFQSFKSVLEQIRTAGYETGECHCANSSALFKYEAMRMDAVRVGSALLGRLSFRNKMGLTRVGWCEATVEELRWLPTGHTEGYGAAWKAKRPTRVAIVSVGYYHGFGVESGNDIFRPRDLLRGILSRVKALVFKKAIYVTVNGQKCRVLGHIGMLHTAIDVTDTPCALGDPVVLEINPLQVKGLEIVYR
jgi:alanine racemase